MSLQDNLYYYNLAKQSKETLEEHYMMLEKLGNMDSYVETTKKLKEYLTTIKVLLQENKNVDEDLYQKAHRLTIDEFAKCSEFNCFINACDASLKIVEQNFEAFKKIVNLFIAHREITELTPKEWIQALVDKGSQRRQGSTGEIKLITLSKQAGFIEVKTWEGFLTAKFAVVRFSSNGFDIPNIKKKLGIDLAFGNQDKMLDIILKAGNNYFFIEAKHLKEGGGAQDKQINELIDIVKQAPIEDNVYYGAFLDGVYSNVLLEDFNVGSKKLKKQKTDIFEALNSNKKSFWLNTSAFQAFIKDLKQI